MTCQRAAEIDIASFLADARDPATAEFRRHVRECPDCRAEVREWTDLHRRLQKTAAEGHAHPPEELLLRLEEAPATLAADERLAVEEHLASCRSCNDELAALRSFDFDALRRIGLGSQPGWRWSPAGIASSLRKLVLHPAFAYGLLLLLLIPTAANYFGVGFRGSRSDRVPRQESPELGFAPTRAVRKQKEPSYAGAPRLKNGIAAPEPAVKARGVEKEQGSALSTQPSGRAIPNSLAVRRLRRSRSGANPSTLTSRQEPRAVARAEARQQGSWAVVARGAGVANLPGGEETAMGRQAHAAPGSSGWAVLTLAPESVLEAAVPSNGLVLKVPIPQRAATLADLEVRVHSPDRSRELRERVSAAPGARFAELLLPAPWLNPGRYEVNLWSVKPGAQDKRLVPFTFVLH